MPLPWKPLLAALGTLASVTLLSRILGGGDARGGWGGAPDPFGGLPVEPYADRDTTQPGQCDPAPKPGVLLFRTWALGRWGQAGSAPQNISRDCAVGPNSEHPSEHHEGRAWDVMTTGHDHGQAIVDALTAPDAAGTPDALARRAGIMYMIWNRQMWRAYPMNGQPSGSWQPYTGGESAHTDHVHLSFSRAGAAGETSLYGPLRAGAEIA